MEFNSLPFLKLWFWLSLMDKAGILNLQLLSPTDRFGKILAMTGEFEQYPVFWNDVTAASRTAVSE